MHVPLEVGPTFTFSHDDRTKDKQRGKKKTFQDDSYNLSERGESSSEAVCFYADIFFSFCTKPYISYFNL